jgi:hypothetical protein
VTTVESRRHAAYSFREVVAKEIAEVNCHDSCVANGIAKQMNFPRKRDS